MKISFVIPAYNSQNTIEEAIDSILKTNFNNGDEIIVVNDSSSDKTQKIVEKIIRENTQEIKIINNDKNVGCPASRNIGIKQAKNELIFSFDSDNVLSSNSIVLLKETLIDKKADLVTFRQINFFNKKIKNITHKWLFKIGWFNLEDLFSGNLNPGPVGNYLFTKESWERVGGFSELEKGLHEAWIFTFKQLMNNSKIYVNKSGFYYHRYGHESLTIREYKKKNTEKNILEKALENKFYIFEESEINYIKKNNPEWIHNLNKRPLRLKKKGVGENGKLVRTPYGIFKSIINKCKYKK